MTIDTPAGGGGQSSADDSSGEEGSSGDVSSSGRPSTPPQDSDGGVVSPGDGVEDAADSYDSGQSDDSSSENSRSSNTGGSLTPPQDSDSGVVSPGDEVEDAAHHCDSGQSDDSSSETSRSPNTGGSSTPPQNSDGGVVSPGDDVEDAAGDYDGSDSPSGGGSSTPPQNSDSGVVSPRDEIEDAADAYDSGESSAQPQNSDSGVVSPGNEVEDAASGFYTPERIRVNEDVEMRPVSSREEAADLYDRRLENFDVGSDEVRRSDDGWVLTESTQDEIGRRQATVELDGEYSNVDVGLGDVRETEDGYVVREGLRERATEARAADRLDDEYPGVDISTLDVETTSDGMVRVDEETQTEIATMRIVENSDLVGPDSRFGEDDLEFDFEDGELVDVSISSEAQSEAVGMPQEETTESTDGASGFTWLDAGDEWPTTGGEAVSVGMDLLTGDGAELIETDAPTNRREVSRTIISARRERLGIDIDPIDPGDAADSAVDRTMNLGREEGALVAAGLGVIVPEPSTTTAGAAILVGAAGVAVASAGSELDVGQPNQDVSEVEAGEPAVSEIDVSDPDVAELEVGEFAPDASEIQVGDPTRADGEVGVPSVEMSTTVGSTQPGQITDEDIPGGIGNPTDSPSIPDPFEEDTSDDTVPDVERDFPTGDGAVVDDSVGTSVGEDVGEPEVEAGFELDQPTEGTEALVGTGGLGDAGVGVGPGAWFGPMERSGATEATDVAADISVGNAPATAPMVDVYSASPAQAFATPYPQAFGNNQWIGNAYATSTTQASRTQQGRRTPRPPFPGFESSPDQSEPPGASPVDIQITNPVATATDVLGVGSGMEMVDSSPDAMPAEDDFEDEWPSDAGFGGFDGWNGGDGGFGGFDGAGFGGASFDGADDMWDPDNWENDQGGQGGLFGGV